MDRINTPGTTGHNFDNVYRRLKEIMQSITAEEWQAKIRKSRAEEKAYAAYDKIVLPALNEEIADDDFFDFDDQQLEQPPESEHEQEIIPLPSTSNQQKEHEIAPNVLIVTPGQPLKCPGCSFETMDEVRLRQHMDAIRQCDHCEKSFHGKYGKRNLTQHLKSHVEKPEIKCDICSKTFKFQSVLKTHKVRGVCGRK